MRLFFIILCTLSVYGNFAPSFMPFRYKPIALTAERYHHIATADMDGDGDQDIVTLSDSPNFITLHENRDGSFRPLPISGKTGGGEILPPSLGVPRPGFLRLGDYTGNGKTDIFITVNDKRYNEICILYENHGELYFVRRKIFT
ncbi:MAG: FG-GAP repeat domain-containing protein [Fibrobacterota bacterium]